MPVREGSLQLNSHSHPLCYTGTFSTLPEYLEHLVHIRAHEALAPYVTGLDVLDVGCNNGYATNGVRPLTRSIVGVDVSPSAIEDGKRLYGAEGLRLELFDGVRLPFDDASFDTVMSMQVIEHIDVDLIPQYLGEIRRVLRPGGHAIFTTPNSLVRLDPGQRPWNPFHVREFTPDGLRAELSRWFASVEVRGMFGDGPTYARVRAGYAAARAAARPRSWKAALKAVPIVGAIGRRLKRATMAAPSEEDLRRYSASELVYRTESLDEAIDLMAVCTVA